jgi:hypothetical protein
MSVDIDLFTDTLYGAIDFDIIDTYLRKKFPYVTEPGVGPVGMGRSYFIGVSEEDAIKLDLYYTDPFIQEKLIIDQVRMATIEEIIAMKIDVVQRGGRKKDFWDLHEVMERYSLEHMIDIHSQRYPHHHDALLIRSNFIDFSNADDDFEPICLRGRYWELIKFEIVKACKENH